MKVIIAGSRNWEDHETIAAVMAKFSHLITEVVSGGARGADTLGAQWAHKRGYKVSVFPYRDDLGKAGGAARNGEMARYADALVAFRDYGASRGTDDMISQAKKNNLLVWVVSPTGNIRVFAPQGELFPPAAK